jgi:hypothetical protein
MRSTRIPRRLNQRSARTRNPVVAGDAVPHASQAGELPGGDGDQLAGPCAVAAPRRLARRQLGQPARAEAGEATGHRAARQLQAVMPRPSR